MGDNQNAIHVNFYNSATCSQSNFTKCPVSYLNFREKSNYNNIFCLFCIMSEYQKNKYKCLHTNNRVDIVDQSSCLKYTVK